MIIKMEEDHHFLSKIIWTDDCKFSKEGMVNSEIVHVWVQQNIYFNLFTATTSIKVE